MMHNTSLIWIHETSTNQEEDSFDFTQVECYPFIFDSADKTDTESSIVSFKSAHPSNDLHDASSKDNQTDPTNSAVHRTLTKHFTGYRAASHHPPSEHIQLPKYYLPKQATIFAFQTIALNQVASPSSSITYCNSPPKLPKALTNTNLATYNHRLFIYNSYNRTKRARSQQRFGILDFQYQDFPSIPYTSYSSKHTTIHDGVRDLSTDNYENFIDILDLYA